MFAGIDKALKNDGYLVIFEAVTKKHERVKQRLHVIKKQQLIIRTEEFYEDLFSQNDFRVHYQQRFPAEGKCSED